MQSTTTSKYNINSALNQLKKKNNKITPETNRASIAWHDVQGSRRCAQSTMACRAMSRCVALRATVCTKHTIVWCAVCVSQIIYNPTRDRSRELTTNPNPKQKPVVLYCGPWCARATAVCTEHARDVLRTMLCTHG